MLFGKIPAVLKNKKVPAIAGAIAVIAIALIIWALFFRTMERISPEDIHADEGYTPRLLSGPAAEPVPADADPDETEISPVKPIPDTKPVSPMQEDKPVEPTPVVTTDRPTDFESPAFETFYDFLTDPQPFISRWNYDPVDWNINDIQFAELIDLDNDGIFELILIINNSSFTPSNPGHHDKGIMILGYFGGQAEIVYSSYLSAFGSDFNYYIAHQGADGKMLFINHDFDHFDIQSEYYELIDGKMTLIMTTEFSDGYDSVSGEDEFIVNGITVSWAEYSAELAKLGIFEDSDDEDALKFRFSTVNKVQATLARLGF